MFAQVLTEGHDAGGSADHQQVVFCLRRHPTMTFDQFDAYWREMHAPLVRSLASILGIRRYVQRPRSSGPGLTQLAVSRKAPEPFDGIAELEISHAALTKSLPDAARRGARTLIEDERRFIDLPSSPIFVVTTRQMPLDLHENPRTESVT